MESTTSADQGHSPTHVVDFEATKMSEANELQQLAPILETAKAARASPVTRSSPKRPPKVIPTPLPTLEESERSVSSAEESQGSPRRKRHVEKVKKEEFDVVEFVDDGDDDIADPPETSPKSGLRNLVEIDNLKSRAAMLASRGKEEEAVQFYSRALRLMKIDLNAVTRRVSTNPADKKWGNEWLLVAGAIAEVRTAIAILCERLGAYAKAIQACKDARDIYECSPLQPQEGDETVPEVDAGVKQMNDMVERLNSAQDSFDARKKLHEEAIQLRRQISVTRDPSAKDDLGRKAFVVLYGALDMEKESLGETHPQVADTHNAIGMLHHERNEMKDAIKHLNKSVSILKLCLGPYHPRSAIAFRELAKLYDARRANSGDIDMAIGLYSQATASLRECYGPKSAMVGASLNNEAVMHILQSNYDLAVEKLSDALVAYETSKMNKNKIINTESAQVWKNLGECHCRRQEFESAHFAYNNALSIQKDARRQAEQLGAAVTPGCDDASIADTLLRLGNATKQTLRYEDAHRIYREALLIFRKHYTSAYRASNGRVCDNLADAQDRLAHTLYCIAEVQEIRGIYEEAEALYAEALQLRLHSDAQREQSRMNLVHVAMSLAGTASCNMKRGEFDDAIAAYKESIKYLEKHGVPEDHELMKKVRNRLEDAERRVLSDDTLHDDSDDSDNDGCDVTLEMDAESKRLMENGEFDKAIEVLSQALTIRRRRLTRRQKEENLPLHLPEKEDVAMTLVNYATILFQKGEVSQAEMLTREAVRMHQSNGHDDQHPIVRSLLDQLDRLSHLHTL